jgi:hypothetical protein
VENSSVNLIQRRGCNLTLKSDRLLQGIGRISKNETDSASAKSSKTQAPSSRKAPNSKLQIKRTREFHGKFQNGRSEIWPDVPQPC